MNDFNGSDYILCSFEDILRLMHYQPEKFRLLARYHGAFVPHDLWMTNEDRVAVLSTIMKGIKQELDIHRRLFVNVVGKQSELKSMQKI